MKVIKGVGGSVHPSTQEKIDKMNMDVRFDVCPTCAGSGKAELPDFTKKSESSYWWFRKLYEALAKKPKGVELLLMNNMLIVIEEPESGLSALDSEDVRLNLGEAGKIKYITSEIKYQFDDQDGMAGNISQEDLERIARESFAENSTNNSENPEG